VTNEKQQQPTPSPVEDPQYSGLVDEDIRKWLDSQRNVSPVKKS
jgi:hypothetical protein